MEALYKPADWKQRVGSNGRPNMNINPIRRPELFNRDQHPVTKRPYCLKCKGEHTLDRCPRVREYWNKIGQAKGGGKGRQNSNQRE